jgi:hypothetical protein
MSSEQTLPPIRLGLPQFNRVILNEVKALEALGYGA